MGAGLLAPFWSEKVGATGMTWDSGCITEVNFLGHCHTVLWEPFFSKQLNCVPFFLVCFLGSIPGRFFLGATPSMELSDVLGNHITTV